MKTPTLLTPPFFKFYPIPLHSFYCFISLAEYWITPHLMWFFSKYYRLKLVEPWCLEARCCVFHVTRHQFYWRFDTNDMTFVGTLIWDHTQRQKHTGHTGSSRMTHTLKMYNNTTCYVHKAATYIILNKWLADIKIYFTKVHNVLAFQKLLPCRNHISAD